MKYQASWNLVLGMMIGFAIGNLGVNQYEVTTWEHVLKLIFSTFICIFMIVIIVKEYRHR